MHFRWSSACGFLCPATRGFVGTMAYIPKEVLNGKRWSHLGDVWSAGVAAFEIITGLEPFAQASPGEITTKVVTQDKNVLDYAWERYQHTQGVCGCG